MSTDSFDLAEAAAALRPTVHVVEGHAPFVVVPEDHRVHSLEQLLKVPARARGTTTMFDMDSFIAQVKAHKRLESRGYMVPSGNIAKPPAFVVVLNDHESNLDGGVGGDDDGLRAGWRDWRVIYDPPLSPEWTTWCGANKKKMGQVEFSQFIEDNLPDIVEPEAATVLEVSRSIEAKKKVNFQSDIRLSNGSARLNFEEEVHGMAAKGTIEIPEEIAIAIPVLLGGPRYRVRARLRYSIVEAKLALWIDLLRPHAIMQDAVDLVRLRIAQDTALPILVGSPGS